MVAALLLALASVGSSEVAWAQWIEGVNNVHLGWDSPDRRAEVIDDMARAGVASVRVDLIPPYSASLDALDALSQRGMSIELVVSLSGGQLVAARPVLRPGHGSIYTVAPLSQLDPQFFKTQYGALWTEIVRRRIRLVAIEVGNEINWAAFNGDLAASAEHQKPPAGAPGLEGLMAPEVYLKGLRLYWRRWL